MLCPRLLLRVTQKIKSLISFYNFQVLFTSYCRFIMQLSGAKQGIPIIGIAVIAGYYGKNITHLPAAGRVATENSHKNPLK